MQDHGPFVAPTLFNKAFRAAAPARQRLLNKPKDARA